MIPSKLNAEVEIVKCGYCNKKMPVNATCANQDEADFCSNHNHDVKKREWNFIQSLQDIFK